MLIYYITNQLIALINN